MVLFVRQEKRAPQPILDLSLVTRSPFLVANIFNVLTGACFNGFFAFLPYYVTLQYGMSTLESGAILTPRSLTMIAVSTTISFLLPRIGYRRPMLAGMLCVTIALSLLGLGFKETRVGGLEIDPLVPLIGIMALSGLGMGMLIPSSSNANLDMLPQRAAVLSGIRGLFHNTGECAWHRDHRVVAGAQRGQGGGPSVDVHRVGGGHAGGVPIDLPDSGRCHGASSVGSPGSPRARRRRAEGRPVRDHARDRTPQSHLEDIFSLAWAAMWREHRLLQTMAHAAREYRLCRHHFDCAGFPSPGSLILADPQPPLGEEAGRPSVGSLGWDAGYSLSRRTASHPVQRRAEWVRWSLGN